MMTNNNIDIHEFAKRVIDKLDTRRRMFRCDLMEKSMRRVSNNEEYIKVELLAWAIGVIEEELASADKEVNDELE